MTKIKWKICLAVVLVLMLLFTGCTSKYKGLDKPLSGAQPDMPVVSDGGIAARQGEWIYYINGDNFTRMEGERFSAYAGALCRMKADGSEKAVVVDRDVNVFNIRGNVIYLCVYEDNGSEIAKVNIDGTGYCVLKKIDDIFWGGCYGYTDDYIYYSIDFKLYRLDISNNSTQKLTDFAIYNLCAGDSYTYFTRDIEGEIGSVYKVKNGENTVTQISKGAGYVLYNSGNKAYYYMLGNGTVYEYDAVTEKAESVIFGGYTDYAFTENGYYVSYTLEGENDEAYGIFAIPAGGGTKTKLTSSQGMSMVIFGEYIYFINVGKLNMLYRVGLDGTNEECVSNEYVYNYQALDIVDDHLYFYSDSDYGWVYRIQLDQLISECIEFEDIAIVG